jgi:hypothetical protein
MYGRVDDELDFETVQDDCYPIEPPTPQQCLQLLVAGELEILERCLRDHLESTPQASPTPPLEQSFEPGEGQCLVALRSALKLGCGESVERLVGRFSDLPDTVRQTPGMRAAAIQAASCAASPSDAILIVQTLGIDLTVADSDLIAARPAAWLRRVESQYGTDSDRFDQHRAALNALVVQDALQKIKSRARSVHKPGDASQLRRSAP